MWDEHGLEGTACKKPKRHQEHGRVGTRRKGKGAGIENAGLGKGRAEGGSPRRGKDNVVSPWGNSPTKLPLLSPSITYELPEGRSESFTSLEPGLCPWALATEKPQMEV